MLAFPCNQFGAQEPGTNEEILDFATSKYDVNFPMFEKVEVNGDDACALYRYLKEQKTDAQGRADIAWNFTKFLVDGDGRVVKRYEPKDTPEEIDRDL